MPKFGQDDTLEQHRVGNFGFSAVAMGDLDGAAGYTLATLVCDRSGSTSGFQQPMEDALKASVEALRKHPNADTIMMRVVTVADACKEEHGFVPLPDVEVSRYDGMLAPQGMTSLFDGLVNAAEALAAYGQILRHDRYRVNGILICITDGLNNAGKFRHDGDVVYVKDAFTKPLGAESLESLATILIAVNVTDRAVSAAMKKLHTDAGFTVPMIELQDAKPDTIAKIGQFISASVSSTSQALGTGAPSQSVTF